MIASPITMDPFCTQLRGVHHNIKYTLAAGAKRGKILVSESQIHFSLDWLPLSLEILE